MTLPLVTADERARLLAHGAALAARQRLDPLPVARLFTPDAHVTWLLVSLDRSEAGSGSQAHYTEVDLQRLSDDGDQQPGRRAGQADAGRR
ncbi:hypothetical protein C1925_09420 [Stenotrophomonas sp. SAU14A_NAIMI4_5]|nr:hypothetical protein C1925_09420 [Stenotrophomonas sp. SAU14A_NAIMI4_5]